MGQDYPRKYFSYKDFLKECKEIIERVGIKAEDFMFYTQTVGGSGL